MTPKILAAPATLTLFMATIVSYLIQIVVGGDIVVRALGLIPARVSEPFTLTAIGQPIPAWLTLFTYMFPHGGWWHIAMNMAGLWFFGRLAEPIMASVRLLLTYLASGVFTGLVIILLGRHWTTPVAGASGAICGLLGAFMAIRLPRWPILDPRNIAILAVEGISTISVTSWFLVRTPPRMPDRMSALMWHLIPFLTAWIIVRISRQIGGMRKED